MAVMGGIGLWALGEVCVVAAVVSVVAAVVVAAVVVAVAVVVVADAVVVEAGNFVASGAAAGLIEREMEEVGPTGVSALDLPRMTLRVASKRLLVLWLSFSTTFDSSPEEVRGTYLGELQEATGLNHSETDETRSHSLQNTCCLHRRPYK